MAQKTKLLNIFIAISVIFCIVLLLYILLLGSFKKKTLRKISQI